MSIQWTIIASFLYVEIAFVIILLLPFISPARWQKLFKSRFLRTLEAQANIYFSVFIGILILFFIDAIRDMRKYSVDDQAHTDHSHLSAELQAHMKLFRAQRNFFISGFAVFLWLVVRRLVTLISTQATLMASTDAAMKQAQSATDAAQKLLDEAAKKSATAGYSADNEGNSAREKIEYEKEIVDMKKALEESKD
jgi:B-cell receptor-associated protein 31